MEGLRGWVREWEVAVIPFVLATWKLHHRVGDESERLIAGCCGPRGVKIYRQKAEVLTHIPDAIIGAWAKCADCTREHAEGAAPEAGEAPAGSVLPSKAPAERLPQS